MTADLLDQIKEVIKGEVLTDEETLTKNSRDASVFEVKPQVVVAPEDAGDISELVNLVSKNPGLSLAARAAGTDMSGGSLTDSIMVSFTQNMNHILEVGNGYAVVEPGVMYRDLEKATLATGQIFPSYPASKNICAVGGMVANDAGGEKSLKYGKTIKYVQEIKAVLCDGKEYLLSALTGEIHDKIYTLLSQNHDLIQQHRPKVSKNSTGYQIWDVYDKEKSTVDLVKLFVGSQGTLGLMTQVKLGLVPVKKRHGLLIGFMRNFENLPEIVHKVLKYKPDSFESFDSYTFKLALKFFTTFSQTLSANYVRLALAFLPEFFETLFHGMPKLIILIEFEEDEQRMIDEEIKNLSEELKTFLNIYVIRRAATELEAEKYWAIRRESFNLLRHKAGNLKAAPFIDDFCVVPEVLPEFLPRLYALLDEAKLLYTVAGHVGDGNFHIIPLMDLAKEEERRKIYEVGEKVFDLVLSYGGSLSGEHNDGLIRSPYIERQFGPEIYKIFAEIKKIFDPQNIFNPHKKIGVTREYAQNYLIKG